MATVILVHNGSSNDLCRAHQATIWTNLSNMESHDIHLKGISFQIRKVSIVKMCLKITN